MYIGNISTFCCSSDGLMMTTAMLIVRVSSVEWCSAGLIDSGFIFMWDSVTAMIYAFWKPQNLKRKNPSVISYWISSATWKLCFMVYCNLYFLIHLGCPGFGEVGWVIFGDIWNQWWYVSGNFNFTWFCWHCCLCILLFTLLIQLF